jgi:hypothetical protein
MQESCRLQSRHVLLALWSQCCVSAYAVCYWVFHNVIIAGMRVALRCSTLHISLRKRGLVAVTRLRLLPLTLLVLIERLTGRQGLSRFCSDCAGKLCLCRSTAVLSAVQLTHIGHVLFIVLSSVLVAARVSASMAAAML